MDKVVIIGSPGAGKSTFAQRLGKALEIDEVLHLDCYFWRCDWKEYPRTERIKIQQELICGKDRWIVEGSYISSARDRFYAADTIIFLDLPRLVCLWRVIKRHITTYRQFGRPDIPEGCTDRLDLICVTKILTFPHRGRKLLLEGIHEQEQKQGTQKGIILCSNEQIQAFLHDRVIEQAYKKSAEQITEKAPIKPFLEKRDLVTPLA
jgi:adenylate kinase family enzyme